MDQAGNTTKVAGLATRMAAQDVTNLPQDMIGETRKKMRIKSTKAKATADGRRRNILTHRRRTSSMDLAASTTRT
jgi:hypothetical protein